MPSKKNAVESKPQIPQQNTTTKKYKEVEHLTLASSKPVARSRSVEVGVRCARCLGIYLPVGVKKATLVATTEEEIMLCYKDLTAVGYNFNKDKNFRVALCVRENHLVKEGEAHPVEVDGVVVYICDKDYQKAAKGPLEVDNG